MTDSTQSFVLAMELIEQRLREIADLISDMTIGRGKSDRFHD